MEESVWIELFEPEEYEISDVLDNRTSGSATLSKNGQSCSFDWDVLVYEDSLRVRIRTETENHNFVGWDCEVSDLVSEGMIFLAEKVFSQTEAEGK